MRIVDPQLVPAALQKLQSRLMWVGGASCVLLLGFGTNTHHLPPDGPQFCILAHLHFNGVCRGHRRRQLLVDSLSRQLITMNATASQKSGWSLGPVIRVLADWIGAARRLRGLLQRFKCVGVLEGCGVSIFILVFFLFSEIKIFHGRPETG